MNKKTAVVLGASGLIGNLLTHELIQDSTFEKVRVLVRKPLQIEHEKLEVHICDFSNKTSLEKDIGFGDVVFCCIGTTLKQVNGNKEMYRKIDFDIPVNAAKIAKEHQFKSYVLVSSIGANSEANGFYLQLKGAVEKAINELDFESFHVFRPSFLLGERKEFRLGEWIIKHLFKYTKYVWLGSLKKYTAVEASDVAKAMIAASKKEIFGLKIL
ncbi:MAG: NAD(P)H-binding protein [Chitinophagaceae bacterium]